MRQAKKKARKPLILLGLRAIEFCKQGLKKMPRIFLYWDLNPHSFCTENILTYNQPQHNS